MTGQWGTPAPYGQQPWQPVPTSQSVMRAAHADRERTVDVLKAAYAEGRLSAAEYEQRMASAHQAATYGELSTLVADLPSGPMAAPFGAPVPATFLQQPPLPVAQGHNGLAVASAILGGLCVFTGGLTGLPAVITGHMARSQIRRTRENGDGLAILGLVFGWLSLAGWVAFVLLVVAVAGSGSPQ
ncbi:DUF1707 and DUF4190 domain-containing protein [Kitasatospora sp. NPDC092948]|uniref:DUF1707 and DUF4190 domain-containing protein n=1 Tax=Kitasatospora sp. NPDC092948 TaxID=3364088 RepID=UPI003802C87E